MENGARFRIGVDVGGTNTDAVILHGRTVLAALKVPTTTDVTGGLMAALAGVLAQAGIAPAQVGMVVIGTTHFTNAVIERRHLAPTAVVRLCLPAAQCLLPMVDWPADLRACIGENAFLADGGFEFDGTPITSFDDAQILRIGHEIAARGVSCIAICGLFSPVNDAFEKRAAALLAQTCPGAALTLSSTMGPVGLLERESASILNSALLPLAGRTVAALREGLARCGLACPHYLSQNDGTLMAAAHAEQFPVLTFASGPTNSMRGAAFLSGHADALVLDIGGTTTDVGLLQHGFPRQASTTVDIGGVRTNFRMPDVFSMGLGGGSLVEGDGEQLRVGPQSVGYEITRRAQVFGGDVLTATDIAVAAGRAQVGDAARVAALEPARVRAAQDRIARMLERALDRCRVSSAPLPVIGVGGGSILMPDRLGGVAVTRPEHFSVANAIGAAIAQTSGVVDRICTLDGSTREAALAAAEKEARAKAVAAGAVPETLAVVDREDVPLAYLKGNATRVRVKVVGDMRF
jgi:N-methylhydantoinase A/oxoprolinase/acetone carboxylase beta subunit